MRSDLEKIQYIEQYLEGKLPSDELQAFEESVKKDPQLAQEVELQKQLTKRIGRIALKEQLNSIHQKQFGKKNKKWWNHVWLNSIIILLGISAFIGYQLNSPVEGELSGFHANDTIVETSSSPTLVSVIDSSAFEECLEDSNTVSEEHISTENENIRPPVETHEQPAKSSTVEETAPPEDTNAVNSIPEIHRNFECLLPKQDTINYFVDKELTHKYSGSNTTIHFPEDLLPGQKTKESNEPIQFLYREFRNQAEMAYADIPMTYSDGKNDFRFSSGGMFELIPLDSTQDLSTFKTDSITIDFDLVDNQNMDYYRLDSNQHWKHEMNIDYADVEMDTIPKTEPVNDYEVTPSECIIIESEGKVNRQFLWTWSDKYKSQYDSISENGTRKKLRGVKGLKVIEIRLFKINKEEASLEVKHNIKQEGRRLVLKTNLTIHPLLKKDYEVNPLRHSVAKDSLVSFLKRYSPDCKEVIEQIECIEPYNEDSLLNLRLYQSLTEAPYIQERRVEKKNTYTIKGSPGFEEIPIVEGLKISGFGVYNCDQIHNINNQITAHPKFTFDSKLIQSVKLIDLNLNAAFGMKKQAIKMDKNSKNILLVFTKDGKLFTANPAQIDLLKVTPDLVLETKDITEIIKNAEDLQKWIDTMKQKFVIR